MCVIYTRTLKILRLLSFLKSFTGSILVAVNPYEFLDMYGIKSAHKYEGQLLGKLPP